MVWIEGLVSIFDFWCGRSTSSDALRPMTRSETGAVAVGSFDDGGDRPTEDRDAESFLVSAGGCWSTG